MSFFFFANQGRISGNILCLFNATFLIYKIQFQRNAHISWCNQWFSLPTRGETTFMGYENQKLINVSPRELKCMMPNGLDFMENERRLLFWNEIFIFSKLLALLLWTEEHNVFVDLCRKANKEMVFSSILCFVVLGGALNETSTATEMRSLVHLTFQFREANLW